MPTNLSELKPISEFERIQGQMLQNVAVIPDGIELAFTGDKCGQAYRIKKDMIGTLRCWQAYFYDWHDGWIQLNRWPGKKLRKEAIEICNQHAVEKHLIKFLPNRPRFKPNPNLWGGWVMATAINYAAGAAGFSI